MPAGPASHLAGLICEQLIGLCYSLIVFDPEGDHVGLGELRGVLVTGGDNHPLADPAQVMGLLRRRCSTVVVDLSQLDADGQAAYTLGAELEAPRTLTGLPQWVVVDEAQRPVGRSGPGLGVFDPTDKGYLLVTWQPEELSPRPSPGLDVVIALCSPDPPDELVNLTAAVAGLPRSEVARLVQGPTGRAVLAWRAHPRQAVPFTLGARATPTSATSTSTTALGSSLAGASTSGPNPTAQPAGGRFQPGRAGSRTCPLRPGCAPPPLPAPRLFQTGSLVSSRTTNSLPTSPLPKRCSSPVARPRSSKRYESPSLPHFRPVAQVIPAYRCLYRGLEHHQSHIRPYSHTPSLVVPKFIAAWFPHPRLRSAMRSGAGAGPIDNDAGRDETSEERDDRNLAELLQELRVAGLGIQVLFGFLLSLPFTSRFQKLDAAQRDLYLAAVLLAAASIVLLSRRGSRTTGWSFAAIGKSGLSG